MLTLPSAVMKSFILFLLVGELLAMPVMTTFENSGCGKKTVVVQRAEKISYTTFTEKENKEKDPPEYFCIAFTPHYNFFSQIWGNSDLLLKYQPLAKSLFAIHRLLLI